MKKWKYYIVLTDELLRWVEENTDLKADNGDFKIEGQYLPVEI